MKDPRYPQADTPAQREWETVEQERDYWKALATSNGATIHAIRLLVEGKLRAVMHVPDGAHPYITVEGMHVGTPIPELSDVLGATHGEENSNDH